MRVALVLDRLVAARGGLESWAAGFADWLLRRGCEVHGLAFEFDDALPPGLVRHRLPRPADRVARAAALAAALDRVPPALVHDFGVGWRFDLLHVHAGSRRTVLRQSLRALPLRRRLRAWLDHVRGRRRDDIETRQYAPGRGRIVAVSPMVKSHLVRDYAIDPARIDVVWNGVDAERFSPAYRDRHRAEARERLEVGAATTFVFLGHNYHLKGLAPALRATARLARETPAVRLCVVGNGPEEAFAALARRLDVARQVRFVRDVADPRPYLAAADVLLHPTFYDSCSLAVLEAWAMGVPAITSRWNGVHELWPAEHGGWVLEDPGDVDEVARAMRRALDPARRASAADAGRAVIQARSLEANFTRIEELYRQVLRTRGDGRG